MAPRKPSAKDSASATKLPKAATGSGIAKRQYKKVRFLENGLLDVERKTGKYLKIARQNQRDSPLLSLPPEIRNKVFAFVLGGKTFDLGPTYIYRSMQAINTTKSRHALALLEVCRQIYAETAILPFRLNTFSVSGSKVLEQWLKDMRPICAKTIASIQLDVCTFYELAYQHQHVITIKDWTSYKSCMQEDQSFSNLTSHRHIHIALDIIFLLGSAEGIELDLAKIDEEEEIIKERLESMNEGVTVTSTRMLIVI